MLLNRFRASWLLKLPCNEEFHVSLGHCLSENLELQMLAVGGFILVHTEFLPVFLPARRKSDKERDLGCGCYCAQMQKPSRLSDANVVT